MITADKIQKLAYLTTQDLEQLIQQNYPGDRFLTSKFLGITNGHQFCYGITYKDPHYDQPQQSKVFVDQDMTADY
jgi:hypothetical protein